MKLLKSFLFRILVSNVLLISLIVFILSTILFFNFRRIGTNIVYKSILDRLYQTSYSTSYLQDASLGVIAQVYMDDDITALLNSKDIERSAALYELKNKLQRIVNASNFVESISVYEGTSNNFFSTKNYSSEREKEFLFNYVNDKKRNDELASGLHPTPRIIEGNVSFNKTEQVPVYTYIMYNNYSGDTRPEKGVILNVKEEWMRNVIKSAGANYLGHVFILNQDGVIMSDISQDMFLKDLSDQAYIKEIFASGKNADSFTTDIDHVTSLVTYVTLDQLGWKFISVLPYSTVVADIERIRNDIFVFGAFIFTLGIILSYFFARKVSSPIFNLKQKAVQFISSGNNEVGDIELITIGVNEAATKLRTLESVTKEKAVLEKETFLRNLLLGLNYKNGIAEAITDLSIDLKHPMMVIVIKIDRFSELKKNSGIDWNSLKYTICNIARDNLSAAYAVEAADTGEDNVTLIINTTSEMQDTEEDRIRPYFIKIQKLMLEYFKLSITIASGRILDNAEELSDSYRATMKSIEYRIILGHQSIITYNYVTSVQEKEYVFPENLEKNIMEAITLRRKEQAEQIISDLFNHASKLGINALHSAILRLVIAISNTAQSIKLYNHADNLANMDVAALVRGVNQLETLEQITVFFKECIQRLVDVLEEKRSTKTTTLVDSIKKYIEANYTDPNLSLKSIADMHHITPAYLGKLYKEAVGKSVYEYINETRFNGALKLLSETSMPINKIIEKTGNSTTLFFKYFRKSFAITPNEYRKRMQKPSTI